MVLLWAISHEQHSGYSLIDCRSIERDFPVYAFNERGIEALEIPFHGGNNHTSHLYDSRADNNPFVALPEEDIGTVFCAGEDQEAP